MSKNVRYFLPGASVAMPSFNIFKLLTSTPLVALARGGSISMQTSRASDVPMFATSRNVR
jgi:hypothetical protein